MVQTAPDGEGTACNSGEANSTKGGPGIDQICPDFGEIWPDLGRMLADVGGHKRCHRRRATGSLKP